MQRNRFIAVRNDQLLLYHHLLLHFFKPEAVAEFWQNHPLDLPGKGRLNPLDLLFFFEKTHFHTPASYALQIAIDLEHACCKESIDPMSIAQTAFSTLRCGNLLPLHLLFKLFIPAFGKFSRPGDLRYSFLRIGATLVRFTSRTAVFEVITGRSNKETHHDRIVFTFDRTLSHSLPDWNAEVFFGHKIRTNPRVFGYPDFDHLEVICTTRRGEPACRTHGVDYASVRDVLVPMALGEFLDEHAISLPLLNKVRNCEVSKACHEIVCQRCGYQIFRKGMVYGAPVEILDIHYRRISRQTNSFSFSSAANNATRANPKMQAVLAKDILCRRRLQQNAYRGSVEFSFYAGAQRIFIDGQPITRGQNAFLLKLFLHEHNVSAQSVFSRQWLLEQQSSLNIDPLNPNLDIRLKRLKSALMRKAPVLYLERVKKATYRFECSVPFTLKIHD